MEAIIFSDMHFYNNPSKSFVMEDGTYSWLFNQFRIAYEIFDYAKHNDIKLVIHNGDLFHEKTRINVGLYNAVWQFFKDMADEGFEIILNTGNHDMITFKESSLRPFSDIVKVITEPYEWKDEDNFCKILPYGQVEGNLANYDRDGRYNILFTHADIAGLKYGPMDYESGAPLKHQIFQDWDIIFNGHIHKPQELGNIVNIGSPMISDWGEADETKRIILYNNGEWTQYSIVGPNFTHFERLTDKLKAKISKNYIDFFRIDIDSEQLKDPIFDKFNVFPRVTKTKKRELRMKDTNTVEEEIERYVEITETKLNTNELLRLGKELYNEVNTNN